MITGMEVDVCCVEVSNLSYSASAADVQAAYAAALLAFPGSRVEKAPGATGVATVHLSSRAAADHFVRAVEGAKPLSHQGRGLRTRIKVAAVAVEAGEEEEGVGGVRQWPFEDPTALLPADQEALNEQDIGLLLEKIPSGPVREAVQFAIEEKGQEGYHLKEIYLVVGRRLELVFQPPAGAKRRKNFAMRSNELVEVDHLSAFVPLFRGMGKDARRTGIPGTLHRISRIVHAVTNPDGLGMIGLVARIGRTLQGHVAPMLGGEGGCDVRQLVRLVSRGGLLIIGPPNVGKTTVLRELARLLASDDGTIVCIVDKTLEICGTDSVPVERAIGNARVLTVGQDRRGGQAAVMIEAIENQSPDVVVVDELSTREECQAARTIVGRGAAVVASVHGESLAQVVRDPERNIITGSITSVTLSAGEAKERADKLRQVERRMGAPVFGAAVELRGFGEWVLHEDIEHTAIH